MADWMIERLVFGANTLGGAVNFGYDKNVEALLRGGSNELDASLRAKTGEAPELTFTLLDVGAALTLLYANSHKIPHVTIGAGADEATAVFHLQSTSGTTRGAAASNKTLTVNQGTLVPVGITSVDGVLAIEIAIHASYDGTLLPVVVADGTSLPAGAGGAAALWRAHAIKDNTTVLLDIVDWSFQFGITVERKRTVTSIFPTVIVLTDFAPNASWSTHDIAAALALSGFGGAIAGAAGLIFYIMPITDAGISATGGHTLTLRSGSPWVAGSIPDLSARPLVLNFEGRALGGTDFDTAGHEPLAHASGIAIPTGTTGTNQFIFGRALDATTTFLVQGGSCDFGLSGNQETFGSDDLPWPTRSNITQRTPSISLTLNDLDQVTGLGGDGRAIATAFDLYLRKLTANGEPIAKATAVHVKITIAAGRITQGEISGDHGGLATGQVLVTGVKGGSAMLAIATAAIP